MRGDARSWADRIVERLPGPVRGLVDEIRGDDVLLFAAGLGFYALVSVVPMVIVVLWVASLLLGDQRIRQFATEAGRLAPKKLGADQAIERVASLGNTIGIWAVVTGLWPATAYGSGLKRAFDRLMHGKDETAKGLRGRGLTLLVLLPLFTVGSLGGALAGSSLLGSGAGGRIGGAVIALGGAFVAAFAALVLIYRIFPPKRLPWPASIRGATLAAAGIGALSVGFVLYMASAADFEQHYATSGLAMVVLFAVWLFCSNVALLVGYKYALRKARGA